MMEQSHLQPVDEPASLGSGIGVSASDLLDMSADVMAVVRSDGLLLFVSASVRDLLGREPHELVDLSIVDLVHPEDLPRVIERLALVLAGAPVATNQMRIAHAGGGWIPIELTARPLRSGGRVSGENLSGENLSGENLSGQNLIVCIRDVAEREGLLETLRWQATHDQLTGLLSLDGLQDLMDDPAFDPSHLIVLRVDATGFQRLNEFYGHRFGDAVMAKLGVHLRTLAGSDAFAARLGGDDFVILLPSEKLVGPGCLAMDPAEFEVALQVGVYSFLKKLCEWDSSNDAQVELSFRVGVAPLRPGGSGLSAIAEAEAALRDAKAGDREIAVFDQSMRLRSERRRTIEALLREELAHPANLTLEYQPVLDAVTRRVVSFEGLARWTTSDNEKIGPGEFIPVAEATGLMTPLTQHVLATAVGQLADWRRLGLESATLSINVPASQIQRTDFLPRLRTLLEQYALTADQLIIELTESNMIERLDIVGDTLQAMREMGCGIAIDDFGTGYSSFGRLRDLPVDYIKLDRSFVAPLSQDSTAVHVVRSMVDLCSRLGFCVVAEGVETQTQADMLTALGVHRLQGYLFSASTTAERASGLIGRRVAAKS
jgi:diguanylate cyclase (GGDEF)-like protein/PAS domain S-box-containing protein